MSTAVNAAIEEMAATAVAVGSQLGSSNFAKALRGRSGQDKFGPGEMKAALDTYRRRISEIIRAKDGE